MNRVIPADARAGTTVGKYKLHEIVGRGGMGVVYRGEHVYIGKEVAVKILHDGYGGREESIKRFLREARAASLINHPNIVDITDFGKSHDGTVFFVMEFLHGEPLDALMQRERRLELIRAITIVNQIAGALGAAHAKGIVHRDLKPENVMLTKREGRRELIRQITDESGLHVVSEREKAFDFVKILDFGVAKVRDPNVSEGRVTQQGVVFGTPEYMAPETARIGVSDPRTDVYALGVIFYEMLTGSIPFAGETAVDVMLKVVSEPVTPPRQRAPGIEITPEAESLIMKALAKDPLRRHQSMEELIEELQHCYGSVRYRRSMERSLAAAPIPQRLSGPHQVSGTIHTPPAVPQLRNDGTSPGAAGGPILLTRRKERKEPPPNPPANPPANPPNERKRTTLPMELPIAGAFAEDQVTPPPVVTSPQSSGPQLGGSGPLTAGHDEWSEPALPSNDSDTDDDDWAELDIDAPDGTSG
ncbi:MAG TPA: serine/threonine-protein kinase [Polyangia bacterium]|nr:serine/threonine-protein kinase [Polyangia bacterium]